MIDEEKFIKTITTFPFFTEEELEEINLIHKASDDVIDAINAAFEYYEIEHKCIALFGNWAISADKDIVNISLECNRYPLLSGRPNLTTEDEIFEHLQDKVWFDTNQRSDLANALSYIELKFK